MKTMMVLTGVAFMWLSISAQDAYTNISTENRWANLPDTKVATYRSMKDVLEHNPKLELNTTVGVRPDEYGVVNHKLLTSKMERKKIGRIYGFSIDNNLYINPRAPKTGRLSNFFQAEVIGNYLHFEKVERIYIQNKNGPPTVISWLSDKLVDVNTGKLKTLNRKNFRKMAAGRPDLLAAFDREPNKRSKLLSYFKEYCKSSS